MPACAFAGKGDAMPTLNFVLPHWLYWSGLLVFPLVAMYLVRRQRARAPGPRIYLFLAYLFWLCAGFIGMHRFYLRNGWGFVFIPVFLAILYATGQYRDAREDVSRTHAYYETTHRALERAQRATGEGQAEALAQARRDAAQAQAALEVTEADRDRWDRIAQLLGLLMLAMLLVDAALIPGAARRQAEREARQPVATAPPVTPPPEFREVGTGEDPTLKLHTRVTDVIDGISRKIGEFVAYWALIAVFFYYYEVMARYVLNSPTNWVHESTFLMFGMQYMAAGAYAYLDDSHVRVDVIYARLSDRGKALADIVSALFFYIFIITMLWTGTRFALDAIAVQERSFTEWGIQYWPVKLAIPVGAFLIALQGLSRLVKDILLVTGRKA
jgi:TRAP-type mannitol/chloroaromatic compound transport system permease small subunit